MGFCLFANAAIAALIRRAGSLGWRWISTSIGNGTQRSSSVIPPFRPAIGIPAIRVQAAASAVWAIGECAAQAGATGAEFRAAWDETILPAGRVLPSDHCFRGFDAHKADPLAQLRLETSDFGWVTQR
jgi:hypothetical protein